MSTTNKAKRVISQLLGESENVADFTRELMSIMSNDPSDWTPDVLQRLQSMTPPADMQNEFNHMVHSIHRWLRDAESGDPGYRAGDEAEMRAIGARTNLGRKLRNVLPGNPDARKLSSDVFDPTEE